MTEPLYIGIDPDVTKSGFAVWHKPLQRFSSIETLSLSEMLDKLHSLRDNIALVVVEAGFLNRGNRHTFKGQAEPLPQRRAKTWAATINAAWILLKYWNGCAYRTGCKGHRQKTVGRTAKRFSSKLPA